MNTIYHGSSFGLGFSGVSAGQNSSASGGTGIGSGDAKAQGESAVKLAVFVKNGVKEAIAVDEPVVRYCLCSEFCRMGATWICSGYLLGFIERPTELQDVWDRC